MIQLRKTLETARLLLSENQIDFALIGGFALGAHGVHRATQDIDFLVDGNFKEQVKKIFTKQGFKIYFESEEIMQLEGIGYIDFVFANRPLSLEMLQRAKNGIRLAGVPVVSKEAIIGLKIQAYKNDSKRVLQDKADIQALLRTGGIDLNLVKVYADLFNAWDEIKELNQ